MADLLRITNGERIPRAAIPSLALEEFLQALSDFVKADGYIVQLFAYRDGASNRLLAVLRNEALYVAGTEVGDSFPSLTKTASKKFHMFEREIAEQYGIRPEGHPWLKPVRYHANYAGRPDVFGNDYSVDIPGNYDYFTVEGEPIHEVAVGPVHAGIIEPGHFRFQCAGEEVLHLEIQLGYQHRGIEKMLTQVPQKRLPIICEGIAGDTSIGHNLCCCQAIEALAGLQVEKGASMVRVIGLELERIANHIGDLGALSGDVAFNPPAAYFGRMRGEFLNLLQVLCGNRFGKGLVRPGGVAHIMGAEQHGLIAKKLVEITPEIKNVCDLLFSAHTVQARFDNTGPVPLELAKELGLVGYAGRACGLPYDVRTAFPTERYTDLPGNTNATTLGDVNSRAAVRREEIMHSLSLIEMMLGQHKGEHKSVQMQQYQLAPSSLVVTLNEGWRGEVSHCVLTDDAGRIQRYKIKDPSFHNWTGLAMSLRNQEISDFPLCNKSYNLSYCGFDL
ncbi:MAG: hydrogenase [Desulfocapsaceae bacterium]|nr:hydrogenase [Desulfocapsaceae bacterium]